MATRYRNGEVLLCWQVAFTVSNTNSSALAAREQASDVANDVLQALSSVSHAFLAAPGRKEHVGWWQMPF